MKKLTLIKIITGISIAIFIICIIIIFSQLNGCNERTEGYEETVLYPSSLVQKEKYESPIDWDDLKSKNPEIYAWIYIPNTQISYPVTQKTGNDTYYLSRDAYNNFYFGGSIMTESAYNALSFDDPVNILYGHNMKSGAMFGTLQWTYSSRSSFDEHREIIIYLPEKELHYKVWAAVPYSDEHLMVKFNQFMSDWQRQSFIEDILNTSSLGGQIDKDMDVGSDDSMIVLSTCITGQSRRFLVIARLEAEK